MITISEARLIQREVATAFGDCVGVGDEAALKEALARPFATDRGVPVYPTFFNKVGALLQGILEHKPFKGANRRTALCVAALLLQQKGYTLRFEQGALEVLFTGIELGFTTNHRVTAWIKGHTIKERAVAGQRPQRERSSP